MKIAGLATIPSRRDFLPKVVESLLPQVDRLYITHNGGNAELLDLPPQPDREAFIMHQHGSGLGDAEKFWPFFNSHIDEECYYFSCDDDLIYPPSYIEDITKWIDLFERKAIVSLHGSIFEKKDFPLTSYYRDRRGLGCLQLLGIQIHVQLPGTGVMGFHTSTIRPKQADFPLPNMADIWFGLAAAKASIPIITVPHLGEGDYLRYNRTLKLEDTIWGREHLNDSRQTNALNEFVRLNPELLFQNLPEDFPRKDRIFKLTKTQEGLTVTRQ